MGDFFGDGGVAACLVLSGEPGIGKTTLWEAGLDLARSQHYQVISTRTSEAETGLSFAALADLVDGIGSDVLRDVPGPQLHALDVALRRVAPAGMAPEPPAVAAGFLSALRALAQRQPLVVAVDDVQWLDDSSAGALQFAARRHSGLDVRFLLSRRTGRPSSLEGALPPASVVCLELRALSLGAISRMLAEHLGAILPRQLVRRAHEASQGNPLFALELGRALMRSERTETGAELPMNDLVDDVFGARIEALTEPVKRVLLATALSAGLTSSELATLVDPRALDEAVSSGLVVVEGSRVRPSHPMLAAAARKHSRPSERRGLHSELAASVMDVTLRAHHLARAALVPDEELAAAVAAAAELAMERGAVQDAEELAAHALRLTPARSAGHAGRLLALARYHLAAGEVLRATKLLTERLGELPAGRDRALAHLLLIEAGTVTDEEAQIDFALAEAGSDPEVRAVALSERALALIFRRVERIDEAESWAAQALVVATASGVEVQSATSTLVWARALGGRPIDDLVLSSAPTTVLGQSPVQRPLCVRLAFRGQLTEARAGFGRLMSEADERGEYRLGRILQFQLCELELRSGDVVEAAKLLEEIEIWATFEEQGEAALAHSRLLALIGAVAGHPEQAKLWAGRVLDATDLRELSVWDRLEATRALGLAALLERDGGRAAEHLQSVWDHTVRHHIDDPGAFPVAADLVEALVESGNGPRAGDVTERLSRLAREQQHPWGLVTAKRCSAVVAMGEGYQEAAGAGLVEAADEYGRLGLHFDRARSLLWLGRAQRRARKRSQARRLLEAAEASFTQMGCSGWADQAGAELGSVSGRRAADIDELTPSEQRAVDLLVRGLSNREIADQLSVSVYTVETHLLHAYAKLGVRSRGQLVHRLGGRSQADGAAR